MDPNQEKVDTTLKGNESNPAQTVAEGKGKGKAVDIAPQDVSMGEDDSSSDEETGAEDEVRHEISPMSASQWASAINYLHPQTKDEGTLDRNHLNPKSHTANWRRINSRRRGRRQHGGNRHRQHHPGRPSHPR